MRTQKVIVCVLGLCMSTLLLCGAGMLWFTGGSWSEVKKSKKKRTFMELCASNMADQVRLALLGGASPHEPPAEDTGYSHGSTPLMVSVLNTSGVEVTRLLLAAGADPNRENLLGRAPLDEAQNLTTLDMLQAAGAWLVGKNAHGVLRARGIEAETAFSETRFFQANDSAFLPYQRDSTASDSASSREMALTPLQQRLFAFVVQNIPLEMPVTANPALRFGYSEQFVFVSIDGADDVDWGWPYHLEMECGAFVLGRIAKDGKSARFYTDSEENCHIRDGEAALQAAALALQPKADIGSPSSTQIQAFHGERICFIDPKSQLPAVGYPYYILTDKGVGIAGKTQKLGCSAELFVPAPSSPFQVFGGTDAVRMNALDPENSPLGAP